MSNPPPPSGPQFLKFAEAIRVALEADPRPDLPALLFMLAGTAARYAIASNMPLRAFMIACENAYDIQQKDYARWLRSGPRG